jgi:hypothetical protein
MPPITDVKGEPLGIIIETNGSMLDEGRLRMLEERFGAEAGRIVMSIGFKATHPEALAELTGLGLKVAERAHQKQLDALLYVALECEHIQFWASFLDKYTDPGIYAALQRECERARPGAGRCFAIQPFKNYGNANKLWTPKKWRGKAFKDPGPERDEEVITEIVDADGTLTEFERIEQEVAADLEVATDPQVTEELEEELTEMRESKPSTSRVPVQAPDESDELMAIQLGFADAVDEQGLDEGEVK